jgi:poly-gamma-glutamate capsule biosynthesis protein CapA/YwtB (metallophosphatase superfamily)
MSASRRSFLKAAGTALVPLGAASAVGSTGARAASTTGEQHGPAASLRPAAPDEATLVCTGDLFLMQQISTIADAATNAVFDVMRQADASFANLENGLSTLGSPDLGGFRHGPALRGAPALAADLRWAGVKAVSLANNHTGNFGPDALLETMDALNRAGIKHAGAGGTQAEAFAPVFLKARDLTVALVSAYTFYYNFQANDVAASGHPGIAACRAYDVLVGNAGGLDSAQRDTPPYVLDLLEESPHVVVAPLKEDVDRVCAAVKQAARRADVTLVSMHIHWGRHTKHDIPIHQRVLARAVIDAGADVFIGHGPHIVRGVERYRAKPIFYSLGNFVLMPPRAGAPRADPAAEPSPGERAIIARIAVKKRQVTAVEVLPIVIDRTRGPRFAEGRLVDRIIGGLYGLSAALGTELRVTDAIATVNV